MDVWGLARSSGSLGRRPSDKQVNPKMAQEKELGNMNTVSSGAGTFVITVINGSVGSELAQWGKTLTAKPGKRV